MKTSVFIPVDDTSMASLEDIVFAYNNAKIRPDEIIINAFGVEDETTLGILRNIQKMEYDNVVIYARKTSGSRADNYNYAKAQTNNEIVLFHNPKTIPSIKRVETVKNHFETTDSYVIHHVYMNFDIYFDRVDQITDLRPISSADLFKRYYPFGVIGEPWLMTHTYGQELGAQFLDVESVCVRSEVLDETKWKNNYECNLYLGKEDGLDFEFALETLYKYKRSVIMNIPLTITNNN